MKSKKSIIRWMVYHRVDGKDVNLWKDNRTYGKRHYAHYVKRKYQSAAAGGEVLQVKSVVTHLCPTCNQVWDEQ